MSGNHTRKEGASTAAILSIVLITFFNVSIEKFMVRT
jgi:hypothetical protein